MSKKTIYRQGPFDIEKEADEKFDRIAAAVGTKNKAMNVIIMAFDEELLKPE